MDPPELIPGYAPEMRRLEHMNNQGIMYQIENYDISEDSLSYSTSLPPLQQSQLEGSSRQDPFEHSRHARARDHSIEDSGTGISAAQQPHYVFGHASTSGLGANIDESTSFGPTPSFVEQQPHSMGRLDLTARNTIRDLIFNALISDHLSAPQRVALLDDARTTAERANLGIPFRALLSEPVYPLGVPPLMYELMGCQPQWDYLNDEERGSGMELVVYLINNWHDNYLVHGKMGNLSWVVRTACLRRFDEDIANRLFQQLRPIVSEKNNEAGHGNDRIALYEISLSPLEPQVSQSDYQHGFNVLISVPYFAMQWRASEEANKSSVASMVTRQSKGMKVAAHDLVPANIAIEFFAARRAWRLDVGDNELKLHLVDGPGGCEPCRLDDDAARDVDARVKVIVSDPASYFDGNEDELELLFPLTLLRPVGAGGPGSHVVSLSPCFGSSPFLFAPIGQRDYKTPRGFDDVRLQHDDKGTLLLELTVRLMSPRPLHGPSKLLLHRHIEDSSSLARLTSPPPLSPPSPCLPLGSSEPLVTEEKDADICDAQSIATLDDGDTDSDLYVFEVSPVEEQEVEESLLGASDDWETVSRVDETEEKEGEWVNAGMSDGGE